MQTRKVALITDKGRMVNNNLTFTSTECVSFTLPVLSFFKISLSSSQDPLMIGTFHIPYGR